MSAYFVNKAHIDYLVDAVICFDVRWSWNGQHVVGREDDPNRIGQSLWSENILSLNARYPGFCHEMEEADAENYQYTHHSLPRCAPYATPAALQVIKACSCLAYQSCEHKEWEASEANAILDAIISYAIHKVPGYEEAEWQIFPVGVRA
jgi:hypothetical protein